MSPRREKNISPSTPDFKNRGPPGRRRTVITRSPARPPAGTLAVPDRLRTKVFGGRSTTCVSG
ncbi:hypothetical protein HDA44_001908 [Kribbella solani]|uniref:Uncharacterized protein n=1 Tax=Kribbella solani TaxID=236067 RepID=A0A841DQB1_9ACTN|nr:hypothetical protein [Kribbella solani]